jgi:hypothetical protein
MYNVTEVKDLGVSIDMEIGETTAVKCSMLYPIDEPPIADPFKNNIGIWNEKSKTINAVSSAIQTCGREKSCILNLCFKWINGIEVGYSIFSKGRCPAVFQQFTGCIMFVLLCVVLGCWRLSWYRFGFV